MNFQIKSQKTTINKNSSDNDVDIDANICCVKEMHSTTTFVVTYHFNLLKQE